MAEQLTRHRRFPVLAAVLALLIALGAFLAFAVGVCRVDSNAMLPTLRSGDTIVVWRIGVSPRQGDVVVFERDFASVQGLDVKRVIAVGGQTVRIDYGNNGVYVDGKLLNEPYLMEPMEEPYFEHSTVVVVPEGSVFLMGDNRNNSADSRDVRLGPVDCGDIIGKALFVS